MLNPDDQPAGRSILAYDRELVPWLFEHWAEPFVGLAAPDRSSSILDLACGSGLVVRHLIGRLGPLGQVQGADIDAEMLRYAASTVTDPRISWHESDASSLTFGDDSFDVVTCHQGLQFFPDPHAAMAEVRRVLRPNGKLAVAVWGRADANPWPAALADAVRSLLGDAAGDSMLAVCRLGDADDLAPILDQAGLDDVVLRHRQRTASHPDITRAIAGQLDAMPSGSTVGDLDADQKDELAATMRKLLADHTSTTGELTLPSTCLLGTATKPS
ncbi:MAG: class I SAM-dependent methyltransferase [Acidimicrobiales bacterium]